MALAAAALTPALAHADAGFAPVDAPGPALSVPQKELDASVRCSGGLDGAAVAPVLFVAGTTVTPREDFDWNWERAMRQMGRPYCDVTVPDRAMADIQVAGEYIVHAIREMHARSGRRIAIVGHSQGGMSPRWALRFWPDTRAMVDDLVGLAPSNHGTVDAAPLCAGPDGCAPAIWQQRAGSRFLAALNSGQETFAGVSYTVVYSRYDEVVQPNADAATGSSSLRTGDGAITNVAVQDVCPLDPSEHLATGIYDNTAFALGMDALTHDGPADPARIDRRSVCADNVMPAIDRTTFLADFGQAGWVLGDSLLTSPHVRAEPPLKCYVRDTCPPAATPAARKRKETRKHRRHRRHHTPGHRPRRR